MGKTGIVLLSHGSRLPEAQATAQKFVSMLVDQLGDTYLIEGAALQFNQPDLPTALARIIGRGARKVIIAPVFLYSGLHIKRDIPEIITLEKQKYPGVEITMSRHIGADQRLMDIIIDRIREVNS